MTTSQANDTCWLAADCPGVHRIIWGKRSSALAKSFRLWVTKALLEPLWDRMAATKTLVICYSQSFANYFTLLCYAVGLR